MAERVIPLVDERLASLAARVPPHAVTPTGLLTDTRGRPLRDLRISVTDRCNFRCNYCMPKEVFDKDYPYLPHSALLSFEEITRLARLFLGAWGAQDPPHGRRTPAAQEPRSAGCATGRSCAP